MRKTIHIADFNYWGWPAPSELEPFFLTQHGRSELFKGGNDNWAMHIDELDVRSHWDNAECVTDPSNQIHSD